MFIEVTTISGNKTTINANHIVFVTPSSRGNATIHCAHTGNITTIESYEVVTQLIQAVA